MEPLIIVFHGMVVPPYEYEISINGVVAGTAQPMPKSGPNQSGFYSYGEYLWTPTSPGLITITVGVTDDWDDIPAQVRVMIPFPNEAEENQPVPQIAPKTPTQEAQACIITSLVSLNCRPAPGYEPIDGFTSGQSAEVVAQSEFLWQVRGLNSDELCTVPKGDSFVRVEGDCESVSEFTPLPRPEPTIAPVAEPVQGCTVRQAGGAIICEFPCPDGAAPGEACTR